MDLESVKTAIKSGSSIEISLHSLNEPTQKLIYSSVLELLNFYNKENLFAAVYTALFESAMNAVKANAKKAFFKQKELNIYDEFDYNSGTKLFKKQVTNNHLPTYCEIAKEQGLYIKIIMHHSNDGIKIELLNNSQLFQEEEKRIRAKLALGQKYVSIVDFHKDNSDNSEGEGLGLVVSLLMLKEAGIPTSDFRIGCKSGITRTRIEIPFNSNYITERQKYKLEFDRQSF
ncbi:MAG: hypothetical protein KBF93_10630 [Leptospiraceae bacterium]|nr:hypothetical protein [Leptospiraceae bacterium]